MLSASNKNCFCRNAFSDFAFSNLSHDPQREKYIFLLQSAPNFFLGFTENDERVRSDSAQHQLPDAVPIQVLQSLHLKSKQTRPPKCVDIKRLLVCLPQTAEPIDKYPTRTSRCRKSIMAGSHKGFPCQHPTHYGQKTHSKVMQNFFHPSC